MNKTIYSQEYSQLLKWLRGQRKQKRITMRELGEKLGVIHSWIGKVEQGERRLDIRKRGQPEKGSANEF